jgi:hypothetical protein
MKIRVPEDSRDMRKASPKAKTRSRTPRFLPSSARSRSVCALGAPAAVVSIAGGTLLRAGGGGRRRRGGGSGPPAWFWILSRGRGGGGGVRPRQVRWWRFRGRFRVKSQEFQFFFSLLEHLQRPLNQCPVFTYIGFNL